MIYLNKHNIVFLKPRKVAGTSFELALSNYSKDDKDIITPISKKDEKERSIKPKNYNQENFYFYNHLPLDDLPAHLIKSKKIKKISIIRHPIDMAISYYFWQNQKKSKTCGFFNWLQTDYKNILTQNNKFYFYRSRYFIDYMIRYESLDEDISKLEKNLPSLNGLLSFFKKYKAKSNIRKKDIKLSKDQKRSVADMFDACCSWEKIEFGYRGDEIDRFL